MTCQASSFRVLHGVLLSVALASAARPASAQVESNVAYHKPTRQSTTGFGGESGRAVDGNRDGNWAAASVTSTELVSGSWLEIDLGAEHAVSSVVLYNRTDCCPERLNGARVEVSTTPCDVTSTPVAQRTVEGVRANAFSGWKRPLNPTRFDFAGAPVAGRYVCLRSAGTNPVSVAEVEVMAPCPSNTVAIDGRCLTPRAATGLTEATAPNGTAIAFLVEGRRDGDNTVPMNQFLKTTGAMPIPIGTGGGFDARNVFRVYWGEACNASRGSPGFCLRTNDKADIDWWPGGYLFISPYQPTFRFASDGQYLYVVHGRWQQRLLPRAGCGADPLGLIWQQQDESPSAPRIKVIPYRME